MARHPATVTLFPLNLLIDFVSGKLLRIRTLLLKKKYFKETVFTLPPLALGHTAQRV